MLEHPGEDTLLQDIAQLQALGIRLVLVFGARCRIDRRLPNSDFHDGCRITRASDMPAVLEAVGALQSDIQARLSRGIDEYADGRHAAARLDRQPGSRPAPRGS